MAKQRKLALHNMFPVPETVASLATDTALSKAFPGIQEETLKSIVQDIGRTFGNIPIDSILPNPYQPRKKFDQQKLQELADSLSEEGMLEPILVRVSPTQERFYEIAAGERRWRAATLAGWTHCPAEIMTACPDSRMKRIALLENLQREQLAPLELAQTYAALLQERDEQEKPVYTVRSLAAMLKKDKGHVDDHMALLRVPADARQLIEDDPDIPIRVVRELGNVEDETDRAYLIQEVRARNLKTADVLAILQKSKSRQRIVGAPPPSIPAVEDQEHPETILVSAYERAVKKPSSTIALAVLERKLQRDQLQLQRTIDRITSELPDMGDEKKTLVRSYVVQWRERLQQVVDRL